MKIMILGQKESKMKKLKEISLGEGYTVYATYSHGWHKLGQHKTIEDAKNMANEFDKKKTMHGFSEILVFDNKLSKVVFKNRRIR